MYLFYVSPYLNPQNGPKCLGKKVQWDICYYFASRGREIFHIMTKEWFKVVVDQTSGMKCVIKVVDEETRNHKTKDSEITTGRMPQMPGSKYCPVSSFETYMPHLSTKSGCGKPLNTMNIQQKLKILTNGSTDIYAIISWICLYQT